MYYRLILTGLDRESIEPRNKGLKAVSPFLDSPEILKESNNLENSNNFACISSKTYRLDHRYQLC
jgi:hypothetical protein